MKHVDGATLRERLRHVYWIGGGSSAGKSTIAGRVAARHGLRVYATDDVMADHARRCAPGDCPLLVAFAAMDMDQRWLNRSPPPMLGDLPLDARIPLSQGHVKNADP